MEYHARRAASFQDERRALAKRGTLLLLHGEHNCARRRRALPILMRGDSLRGCCRSDERLLRRRRQ
jgi:hypothetical protein